MKENKFGAFDNYFTFAKDYGDVTYYWHGLDYSVNARLMNGLTIQGGATTGRGIRDTCDVQAKLPEATLAVGFGTGISQVDACAVNEVWQTNVPRACQLHDPEDRRAGQRDHAVAVPTRNRRRRRTRWPATACRSTRTTT